MKLIIGISGKKQAGKSTAANQILAMYRNASPGIYRCEMWHVDPVHGWLLWGDSEGLPVGSQEYADNIICFADYLKRICMDLFGLTWAQCYGTDEQKNTLAPGFVPGKDCTSRDALQGHGSVCRDTNENCFVNAWRAVVSRSAARLILTPDVRYPNEIAAIRGLGGKVIRLTRAPFDDQHESETALDDWPDDGWDALINNAAMSIDRQGEVIRETVTPWLQEAGLIGDNS